jgi:pSer/pThr/pTyr-binding forkhead associated (FHA) protein/outer membrane biosynthesis protein TonB
MEAKSQGNSTPIRLDILDDRGDVGHSSEFVKEKIVLGRILSADVRIDDIRVSRIHALIEVKDDRVVITDLASSHGTFVNGKKVVESTLKWGDTIKLGFVEIRVAKGSGNVTPQPSFEGRPIADAEATSVDLQRPTTDSERRSPKKGGEDRRQYDAFPEENRLDDRRKGDRRVEQRESERRTKDGKAVDGEHRTGDDRRAVREDERRVGQRRRKDRRVFDITSLERRIEERRTRRSGDELLPEELEKAFTAPEHVRELEVTALWGDHILDVSNYNDPQVLTVGESPRNQYIIPSEGIPDEFPLVTIEDDGTAYLAFTDEMAGTVRTRDKIYNLGDLREEKFVKRYADYYVCSLKQDDFAKISIGRINFFALYVRPAPRIRMAPMFQSDPILLRTAIGSLLMVGLLFTSLVFVQKPKPVTIDMIPERFAKIVIKKRPNIPKSGLVIKGETPMEGGSVAGEGGKPKGPEGEVGPTDKPQSEKKAQALMPKSTPPPPQPTPAPPKQAQAAPTPAPAKPAPTPPPKAVSAKPAEPKRKIVDQKTAKSVGLLKAFQSSGLKSDLKNLIDAGTGAPGQGGFDDFGKAVSGLRAQGVESGGGAGGKGLKGVDVGGGGTTIGIDGPSTKGLGGGFAGDGIGEGISGPGRFGKKGEHSISIAQENVQVLSGLPKDVIHAVVSRHRSEIRACYDAALQRNPGLKGKVVIYFNISPEGIVQSAGVKESTLADSGLHGCIVARVKSWQFPKPEAPVVTEVSAYPFFMNPAN